jgi:hypothetical protein
VLILTDANGCIDIDTAMVTPSTVNADAGGPFCGGGSVQLGGSPTASGGTGSYTYNWDLPGNVNNATIANPIANNNNATYVLTVTDGAGCTDIDTTVVAPSNLQADAGGNFCSGGTSQIGGVPTAIGGTGPYTYNWSPSQFVVQPTDANPVVTNNNTIYIVTVTDAAGCQDIDTAVVTPAVLTADAGGTFCSGGTSQIGGNPTATGASAPFTYNWSPAGSVFQVTDANPVVTNNNGTYIVTVTDAQGCTDIDTALTVPSSLQADAGGNFCSGGTSQIGGAPTAQGGTPGYTYNWSPAGSVFQITDANPVVTNNNTFYIVTVTDGAGCTDIDTAYVTPAVLTADAGGTFCSGGTSQIGGNPTATGASAPFTYNWSPAGSVFQVTDANPVVTNNNGTYILTVTDAQGCTDIDTALTIPSSLQADAGGNFCSGGTSQIGGAPTAQGGTPGYTYNWSPAGSVFNITDANPVVTNNNTFYIVTVTDAGGCTDIDTAYVTPAVLNADAGGSFCSGGTSQIGGNPTATGASAPFTYNWSPAGSVFQSTDANPIVTNNNGTFIVTVTDAQGCTDIDTAYTLPSTLVADAGGNFCSGGTSQIGGAPTAQGGVAPYTYAWSPSQFVFQSTDANPVVTNNNTFYVVTVTDAAGCTAIDTAFVTPAVLNADAGGTFCSGGTSQIGGNPTATGVSAPFTYNWSPAGSVFQVTDANPVVTNNNGTYIVTVTDAQGCTDIDTALTIPSVQPEPSVTVTI